MLESENKYIRKRDAPLYWFNKASDLRATAGLVWLGMKFEKSDEMTEQLSLGKGFDFRIACWKPYHMLCGLSLELALKSIIVTRKKEVPLSHNLNVLVRLAEINYTKEELKLMAILSHFIVWSGKYPIPKNSVEMESHYDLLDKYFFKVKHQVRNLQLKQQYKSFDWEVFSGLWEKASSVFFDLNAE